MKIQVLADADAVAEAGAAVVAEAARSAVATRGRCSLALSGGRTPWLMLRALVDQEMPWRQVAIFQVDERVASADSPDRNLKQLRESLLARVPLPPDNLHPMPVEESDLGAAAANYARTLESGAGTPPVLDLVHLGLGDLTELGDRRVADARYPAVRLRSGQPQHPRLVRTEPDLDVVRRRRPRVRPGEAVVGAAWKMHAREREREG